jgi:hypothetical protein
MRSRIPFKRPLAVLLPACFVWLFVACVVMCSEHAARTHEPHVAGPPAETECLDESWCCPMTGTPASLQPERSPSIPRVTGDHHALSLIAVQQVSDGMCFYGRSQEGSPPPGLSPVRLCVLRI